MSIGVVKFFDKKKGFGFITWEEDDIFVHFSDIISDDEFKVLNNGDEVELSLIHI